MSNESPTRPRRRIYVRTSNGDWMDMTPRFAGDPVNRDSMDMTPLSDVDPGEPYVAIIAAHTDDPDALFEMAEAGEGEVLGWLVIRDGRPEII
jgi:hypothetical protein